MKIKRRETVTVVLEQNFLSLESITFQFISFQFFSLRYYEKLISPTDFLTSPKSFMSSHRILSLEIYTFSEEHLHLNVGYNPYTSNWSNVEGLNITGILNSSFHCRYWLKITFFQYSTYMALFPQIIAFSSCIHRNFSKELIFQIISMVP